MIFYNILYYRLLPYNPSFIQVKYNTFKKNMQILFIGY
nr:MAG TPA: hypothetical protein [Caudoviricetes sp.]